MVDLDNCAETLSIDIDCASSNFYNNERASKVFKAIHCRAGDNTLSLIQHNDTLRKGKAC